MTALIRSFDVKKIELIMFYEGINTKVFRRSIAFAISLVVTSRSSSFEYTMSVHAVHAGAERNECNIVVSTESIMLHFIRSTLFVKVNKIFRQKNTFFFLNYNLTPLDMYNGISQVYCIKPERRIH